MRVIMRLLAASAAVIVLAGLTLIFGPNISGMTAQANSNGGNGGGGSGSCQIHYYANDPGKEVSGAFGPPVTPGTQAQVMAQLNERRECGSDGLYDPALVAAQYAAWSNATLPSGAPANLTSTKVNWPDATAFAALLASNYQVYQDKLGELKHLESTSAYSTAPVSAGIPSLYMLSDKHGGIEIHQGLVATNGTNIIFTTSSGVVVRYRLECGFQPNWTTPVQGVAPCVGTECAPPPVCPTGMLGTPPNNCYVPCQYDHSLPANSPMCQPPHVPTCRELNNGNECKGASIDNGWTPRGLDQQTDGHVSSDQKASGQTSGNVTDHKVPAGTTSGSTTTDMGSSGGQTGSSGVTAPGATPGGDSQSTGTSTSAPQDTGNTSSNTGGTSGATCITDPDTGVRTCH